MLQNFQHEGCYREIFGCVLQLFQNHDLKTTILKLAGDRRRDQVELSFCYLLLTQHS